ncbi:hypothetical protein VNO78_00799 [Psophocarpus tetragonolobus]|uniref:Uncharacterized protein n=1 Tax=Psophocarpus tetragonolobus TaxID=3891 RepID=A0AAN9SZT2_PSOTE
MDGEERRMGKGGYEDDVTRPGASEGKDDASGVEKVVTTMLWEDGEAKFGNLEVATGVKKEVLGLEVAMGEALAVVEAKGGDERRALGGGHGGRARIGFS